MPDGESAGRGAYARSCGACRRRKVKCDRSEPCSHCVKSQSECIFPSLNSKVRRNRLAKASTQREVELMKRIARLEGVVQELSGFAEDSPRASFESSLDDKSKLGNTGTQPLSREFSRLVISDDGKSQYLSSDFFATLYEELDDVLDEPDDESSSEEPSPMPSGLNSEDEETMAFIFGHSSASVSLLKFHPLPSQVMFYWDIFLKNVQPLCNIFHVPSTREIVLACKDNLDSLSKSHEALMFSIYFATITSMTDEETQKNLGKDRQFLLKKYHFATEQALAKASFMTSTDIDTFRALILMMLVSSKEEFGRRQWCLTGSVFRIAQSIGLHRDGKFLGLSQFETEMRRRLWWLIPTIETRSAAFAGSDVMIGVRSFDTELPSNFNDTDLDPLATEIIQPRKGITDMSLSIMKHEITAVELRLNRHPGLPLKERQAILEHLSERLERDLFQYCDQSDPIYQIAKRHIRITIATTSLHIYGVQQGGTTNIVDSVPQDVRDRLFELCVEKISIMKEIKSSPSTRGFSWALDTMIDWPLLAYLLREISRRPPSEFVERGWQAVVSVFASWSGSIRNLNNSTLWTPMRKLMANARRKREADALNLSASPSETYIPSPPAFNPISINNTPAPNYAMELVHSQNVNNFPTSQGYTVQNLPYGNTPMDWYLEDFTMADFQAGVVDNSIAWYGWDDVVRDFQADALKNY